MSPTDQRSAGSHSLLARRRLCVLTMFALLATFAIAAFYPSGPPLHSATKLPATLAYGWVWSQSLWLLVPAFLVSVTIARRRPRVGERVGGLILLSVPLLMLGDAITFGWIGERFLSRGVWRLSTSLRGSLASHVSQGTVVFAVGTIVACLVVTAIAWWTAGRLAKLAAVRVQLMASLLLGCGLAFTVPALWQFNRTVGEMANTSARHPFCVIGIVEYHGVGLTESESLSLPSGGGLTSTMERLVVDRERRHLGLTIEPTEAPLRDVVIIVIESFRHELVDSKVMPSLYKYAQKGIHCRSHFSGGNATTHGFFSLLNALEAIWYPRQMNSQPLLNRLFRQAGYEIGFFAGHNDWKKFGMDGFINPSLYDEFQTDKPAWLASDRRATQGVINFLKRASDGEQRRPRLALLYLYSTHADYHSYPQDRIFQPAIDDRFVIPYSADAVPQVWNRYKNSARSIDRFLSAILSEGRIAIITGDHGEAFLEDGVCGHGVRVSQYQNMTPAVIYCPERSPRVIDEPTTHADLLPTLLSAVGLRLNNLSVLDGIDLYAPQNQLKSRLFVTRNYLNDDCAIIGSKLGNSILGFRCAISLSEWKATPLNAIDDAGYAQNSPVDGRVWLRAWLVDRFPDVHPKLGVTQP